MARTTPTKTERWVLPQNARYTFEGFDVPPNVASIKLVADLASNMDLVVWRCHGQEQKHSMAFDHTQEGALAVITAMKLS